MEEKKMKGMPPSEKWESKSPCLEVGKRKYASEFGNPKDLEESNNALASMTRKKAMKY